MSRQSRGMVGAAARAVGPAGTVICVEPNPAVAEALAATLRINNLGQARVTAAALSDRDGEGRLAVDPATRPVATFRQGLTVPLRRLDAVVAEARLSRLDLVKIDVEGHELAVLSGAADSLRRFRPALIFESGHETPEQSRAIAGLLDELGYDIVRRCTITGPSRAMPRSMPPPPVAAPKPATCSRFPLSGERQRAAAQRTGRAIAQRCLDRAAIKRVEAENLRFLLRPGEMHDADRLVRHIGLDKQAARCVEAGNASPAGQLQ